MESNVYRWFVLNCFYRRLERRKGTSPMNDCESYCQVSAMSESLYHGIHFYHRCYGPLPNPSSFHSLLNVKSGLGSMD
jgi:hypothetical protein